MICGWDLGLSNSLSRLRSRSSHFPHDIWTLHVCAMIKLRNKLTGTHRINIFSRISSHRSGYWCRVGRCVRAAGWCTCSGGTATLGNRVRIALSVSSNHTVHWQLRGLWKEISESTWKPNTAQTEQLLFDFYSSHCTLQNPSLKTISPQNRMEVCLCTHSQQSLQPWVFCQKSRRPSRVGPNPTAAGAVCSQHRSSILSGSGLTAHWRLSANTGCALQ